MRAAAGGGASGLPPVAGPGLLWSAPSQEQFWQTAIQPWDRAKTDAGSFREVDLPGGLVDELTEWKMRGVAELAEWVENNGGRANRCSSAPMPAS